MIDSNLIRKLNPFPLMGEDYHRDNYAQIDLSINNSNLAYPINQDDLTSYINNYKKEANAIFAFGGYAEKRGLYQSALFKGENVRDIHLAIDIWHDVDTPLYAPIDGMVYCLQFNNSGLDYGYTLILQHRFGSNKFYTLLGHLSPSVMTFCKVGDVVKKGELFAHLGDFADNGGWSPHVHFQIINDLQGNKGDYPGVCSEEDKEFFLKNCPNPTKLILNINE